MGHLHLALNHFPVAGLIICLAFLAHGLKKNSEEVILVSLKMFVAMAVLTLGAYFTGEPAEELVEHLPGVVKAMIESHELAGTVSLVFVELAGVLSIIALFLHRKTKALNFNVVYGVVAISIIAVILVGYTANLGGQIRHTEIRPGFIPPTQGTMK